MAQFGVTGQGYQDSIKGHLIQPEQKQQSEQDNKRIESSSNNNKKLNLPYEGISGCFNESIYTVQGNEGSYSKLTTIRYKHIRDNKNPNQIYDTPMTDNQNYGWYVTETKNGKATKESENLSWAKSEHHGHSNSQMTKFVDDMALTNREFSLY